MSLLAFETPSNSASVSHPALGRRHRHAEDSLLLDELNPHAVIDQAPHDQAVTLTSVGTVREACPKCLHTHLNLILRQHNVRAAHLFCAQCHSCFDAHYASGTPALTI
ncbi:MAG: hypothetical protein QFF03_21550 [Pseudomonadota bacterium]|nr:hypothetical protein [Pseudomonadota bacterium]